MAPAVRRRLATALEQLEMALVNHPLIIHKIFEC